LLLQVVLVAAMPVVAAATAPPAVTAAGVWSEGSGRIIGFV
jgi:hypothetical protein